MPSNHQEDFENRRIGWMEKMTYPFEYLRQGYIRLTGKMGAAMTDDEQSGKYAGIAIRVTLGTLWGVGFGVAGAFFPPLWIVAALAVPIAFPEVAKGFLAAVAIAAIASIGLSLAWPVLATAAGIAATFGAILGSAVVLGGLGFGIYKMGKGISTLIRRYKKGKEAEQAEEAEAGHGNADANNHRGGNPLAHNGAGAHERTPLLAQQHQQPQQPQQPPAQHHFADDDGEDDLIAQLAEAGNGGGTSFQAIQNSLGHQPGGHHGGVGMSVLQHPSPQRNSPQRRPQNFSAGFGGSAVLNASPNGGLYSASGGGQDNDQVGVGVDDLRYNGGGGGDIEAYAPIVYTRQQ